MSRYSDLAMERRRLFTPEGKTVYNCCQTVVSVFAGEVGYDEEMGMKAATYFRGGMQMGSVCGAVTGSLMVLGMAGIKDPEVTEGLYGKFREMHDGMLNCSDLLRVSAEKGEVKIVHCNALICECIGYVEEVLREKGIIRE